MKWKKLITLCLSCMIMISCIPIKAHADDLYRPMIHMKDMKCEQINPQDAALLEDEYLLRGSDSINGTVSAYSAAVGNRAFYLSSDSTITFNCSYSPSSASMDFGVIAPDGKFYYIKEGSIYQAIRVDQTGNHSVAIRNNSSQTVRVVGFVDY